MMSSSVVRGFRTPPHLRFGHWIPAEALGPHTADMVKEQNERSLNGAAPKTEQWFPNGGSFAVNVPTRLRFLRRG